MVESMVERVARAIAGADPEQQCQIDDSEMGEYFWEKYREHYLPLARAAIEAMREPTDAMVDAGEGTMCPHAACIFTDMIDAALNEQVSG